MTGKACFKNGNNLKGGNEPIHPTGNEKRSDKPSGQKGMPDEFLVQWRSERGGGGAAPSFNSVPTSVVGKSIKIIYVERQL